MAQATNSNPSNDNSASVSEQILSGGKEVPEHNHDLESRLQIDFPQESDKGGASNVEMAQDTNSNPSNDNSAFVSEQIESGGKEVPDETNDANETNQLENFSGSEAGQIDTLDFKWESYNFPTRLEREEYVTYLHNWAEINDHSVTYDHTEEHRTLAKNPKQVDVDKTELVSTMSNENPNKRKAKQIVAQAMLERHFSYYPSEQQITDHCKVPRLEKSVAEMRRRYENVFYFIGSQEFTINCKFRVIWCGTAFKSILAKLGILGEFDDLFEKWYRSKLITTTKWLRFDVRKREFSLKDREGFVKEDSGMRGVLKFTRSEKNLQNFLFDHYMDFSKDVIKELQKNNSKFKCFKFDQVLWSISRIIGRKISTCEKFVAYKVLSADRNGHVYVQPYNKLYHFTKLLMNEFS
jgi:hypothetical protein